MLEIPHLAAERGLRRMQAAFRRELHAAGLGDGDEITKMPQLHALVLYLLGISVNLQSLFQRGHAALFKPLRGERRGRDADGRQALNRTEFVVDLRRTRAA
jgi:hypothetical protein